MSITNIFLSLFSSFVLAIFHVYCWEKILNYKSKIIFKPCDYVTIILCTLATFLTNILLPQTLKILIVSFLLISIHFFLFGKDIKKSIVSVVISQVILAFVETSFIILSSLIIGNKIDTLVYEILPFIILNIYILIVSYAICRTKLIHYVYLLFYKNKSFKKSFEVFLYPLIIIFTMIIATIESHIHMSFTFIITINTIISIIFISITITSQKLKINYNKISNKYETSISSLKEYEVMIDKFRVETHENKNEFLTVRNMIKDNPDEAIKYIDKLVDNKIEDNNKIMKKTAKIPSGGLKATIYSKLCLMDKLKIKYKLNIARDVHTTDLINLDEDLVLKICKILGVFLDNAIEAVKKLKKKEIFIEIYSMDDNLCIDITNNFKGNLDLNKISEQKYTTKGEGHGYGLSLVDKLLKEEPERLENEKSINGDTFTQMLKIKM